MTSVAFALFDTAIGSCGVAWGPSGLRGIALPDPDPGRTLDRLRRSWPGGREMLPPASVAAITARIAAALHGEADDLADVLLDMSAVPTFDQAVYAAARAIGPGETVTYGELSRRIGDKRLARAVGGALGRNPFPIVVPCHRVLAAGGRTGGFSAPGGVGAKLLLLRIERARVGSEPDLFDDRPPASGP